MTDREQINAKLIQIFTEECVDVFDGGGCIIHFPEIEIFNENDVSRTIYDLYVKLVWGYGVQEESKDKVLSFTTAMYGARTTYTVEDVWNTYMHSHLNNFQREGPNDRGEYHGYTEFQEFCLGEDTVYNTLAELNMGFNIDKFIILLNSIDDFVRWESLSGGPYVVMEDLEHGDTQLIEVRPTTSINFVDATIKHVVDLFIKHTTDEEIKILTFLHDEAGTTILKSEEALEMWEKFAATQPEILGFTSAVLKFEDRYFQQNQSYHEMLNIANKLHWEGNIHFKGKNIENKINFSDGSLDAKEIQEKGVVVPHPALFERVIVALEPILTKYLTKTDTWKLKKQDQLW